MLQLTQGPAEPAAQALNKTEDIPLERSAAPEIVENPMIDMSSSSAPSLPSSATICDEAPYDRYVVKAIQEENGGRTKIIQAKHLVGICQSQSPCRWSSLGNKLVFSSPKHRRLVGKDPSP